jgi:hypothetical protein
MKIVCKTVFYVWICSTVSFALGNRQAAGTLVYRGASDASAAVVIDKDMFIVAGQEKKKDRRY